MKIFTKLIYATMLFIGIVAYSQSPGGVSGVAAWYKGDVGLSSTGWNDQSANSYNLTRGALLANGGYMNFNPVATFANATNNTYSTASTTKTSWPVTSTANTYYYVAKATVVANNHPAGIGANGANTGLHSGMAATSGNFGAGGNTSLTATNNAIYSAQTWATNQNSLVRYGYNGGTTANNYMSVNGNNEVASSATVTPSYTNASAFRIGSSGASGVGNWEGNVAEVIVYPTKHTLTDYNKVESYLALKYGISKAGDYVFSTGSSYWVATNNAGYTNNIAGVGRDVNSALYQKQSQSQNTGNQLLIGVGGALADTNAANANSLTDGQFLVWGDNGLSKTPSIAFSGISGVNFRFASIWKVQNTGTVGTVRVMWPQGLTNLKLIQSTDVTFDGSDTATDMSANTQIINGVTYNYANVTLSDGQYFTFASYKTLPGGVFTGITSWFKADQGVTTASGAVSQWDEQSGNSAFSGNNPNQATVGSRPAYNTSSGGFNNNFNPFITFDGGDRLITTSNIQSSTLRNVTGKTATAYIVAYSNDTNDGVLFDHGGADAGNFIYTYQRAAFGSSADLNLTTVYTGKSIIYSGTRPGDNSLTLYANGTINGTATNQTNTTLDASDQFSIGANTVNGDPLIGHIAEVITYNTSHTATEREKVESYLAVKYGITKSGSYVSSNNTVVYNDATYNKNIAGIGRDDFSGLNQKQSQSQNSGSQLLIGAGGALADTNAANTNSLTDGQFLVWGDNGLSKNLAVPISGITGVNFRFASIWRVKNTGSLGVVRVMWPQGLTNLKLVQSSDAVFDGTDTVTDLSANTQIINGITYNYTDVTFADGQYFTFLAYATAPGGLISNLRLWIKANDGPNTSSDNTQITSWANKGIIGGNAQGGNVALQTTGPLYRNDAANSINFNPVAQSTTTSGLGLTGAFETIADDYTMFAVHKNPSVSGYRNFFHVHSGLLSGTSSGFGGYFGSVNTAPVAYPSVQGTASTYEADKNYITSYHATGTGTINYTVNGKSSGSGASITKSGVNLVIGTDADGGGDDGIDVFMPENIMYNAVLSVADRIKVDTYLAVKYGITIDQTTPTNYVTSDDSVIWNATTNSTYKNNIAGIGRDDISALNQKQSMSVNSGKQVLIGLGSLANTNILNAGSFASDKQFLVWGDNGLARSLNTALVFTAPGGKVNNRFDAIWRVQNTNSTGVVTVTWPVGIDNLHLVRSTDATIDATDQFIPMTGTTTVNGVVYNTATITFNTGDYFTFAGYVTGPGGVTTGLAYWYDAGINANTTDWSDRVNGFTISKNGTGPIVLSNGDGDSNFNPFFTFSSSTPYAHFTGVIDPVALGRLHTTFAAASKSGNIDGTYNHIFRFGSAAGSGVLHRYGIGLNTASNQATLHYIDSGGTIDRRNTGYNAPLNQMTLVGAQISSIASGNNKQVGYNGNYVTFSDAITANVHSNFQIGGSLYGFAGRIPEVIYYNLSLSVLDRSKVDTYLAIKYGVTLIQPLNYIASNGNIVWNSATNTLFNNNIFGVAKDLTGSLNQKVSNSINPTSAGKLIVATTKNFTANNSDVSRTALNDTQYLVFGDNNNTSTTLIALDPNDCPALAGDTFRIPKAWMVQNTNDTGAVWLQIDMNAYTLNSDIFLLVGDAVDGTGKIIGNTYLVPGTITGGIAVFNHQFVGVKYFTVGGKVGPSACTTCKGGKYVIKQGNSWNTTAKRTNDDTGVFTYATDGEGTALTAQNTDSYATASNEWVDQWYPWPYGASALMPNRGNNVGASTLRTYTTVLNRAGKVSFDLAGISAYYGRKVKVVVKGFCGSGQLDPIITPKVTNAASIYNSYTISGNTVTGKNPYRGLDIFSQVKVAFSRPVDKVVIEYTIEGSTSPFTHFWFTIGDMSVECDSPLEPNKDNVYIKQSFDNDNITACNEAEMKLKIINNNCNSRVVNITDNTLPAGLEYVADSYNGLGTPVYSGQTFTLNNITIPSGETNLYVKVKSTNPALVVANTTYQTQSTYNVTVASGGTGVSVLSDNLSLNTGLQKTDLTLKPGVAPAMPTVIFTSDKTQSSCGVINYSVTIDNNTGAPMSGLQFMSFLNAGQSITGSVVLPAGVTGTVNPSSQIGENNFFIPDLSIPTGISVITFQMQVDQIDELATNYVELSLDPSANECAASSKVVAQLDKKCATCEGGKGLFDMNYSWYLGGNTARVNNSITNVVVGNPISGTLRADASVTYPNASTEWLPTVFPRWNGNWTELSRYDNLNGAAGLVTYKVNLKDANGVAISAKPSFQIAGMTKISGQTDVVRVRGYCGTKEVLPILKYDYNTTPALNNIYRRFTIDNVTAKATGTKPYYDYYSWATMNVEFEESVDRIEVEWTVDRLPVRKTLGFLYVGDMKFVCDNVPEPNEDNVHIIASYSNDNLLTCESAMLKLNIKNWNCTAKQINLTNTLPSNLQYVADSYSGLGTETPTYSGQSFSLSNLTVPSGNSYIYVKVKPTNTAASGTYNTFYNYTVVGGTNSPNPYRSDDDSGTAGFQDTGVTYTATAIVSKPTMVKTVNKCFKTTTNGNGTELTYTIKVSNPSATPISNVEFFEILDGDQKFVASSLVNPFGGTANNYAVDENMLYISGMTIPANTVDAIIEFKVSTYTTNADISNVVSMTIDPESACASENTVTSNELAVLLCTSCTKDPNTSPADIFTKIGITVQSKQSGWPENIPNGAVALESKTKGFVITRTISSSIANPVEGMIIYDTTDKCIKMYNGTSWNCMSRSCND